MMPDDAGGMTALATPQSRTDGRMPHGIGFWVIALAFLTQMAFCAVPTPLYAIYQERDGFATIAAAHGFADQAHMTRALAAITGIPPGAIRAKSVQAAAGPPR